MVHGKIAILSFFPLVAVCVGCQSSALTQDELLWREAEASWQRGEPEAYEAWRRLDPRGPRGRQAWSRLLEADALYRRAVELLRTEQPGVRETLSQAMALAPMDSAYYLPLARVCRDRGSLERAVEFYRKYLARHGDSPEASSARTELTALVGTPIDWPPDDGGRRRSPPPANPVPAGGWPWWLPLVLATALLTPVTLLAWLRRRAMRPLRALVKNRPEIQQTVAYQIGCLRHEFLKHRIGAAVEALHACSRGEASVAQRRFLEERLRGAEPLLQAWQTHIDGLERSLGIRFALTAADPLFGAAQRALAVFGRVARVGKASDPRRLGEAERILEALDRELADVVAGLATCSIDEALLRDVLQSTRAEWASGKVELDDVVVGPVPSGLTVDVYRTDLRIVLKNVFRNAIIALGQCPRPRRLAVDVLVDLEPTGEEVVRIRVRDSSSTPIALGEMGAEPTGVEHGLGIVRTALLRYDGSLEIAEGGDGYAKAVIVRLFRSQGSRISTVGEAA